MTMENSRIYTSDIFEGTAYEGSLHYKDCETLTEHEALIASPLPSPLIKISLGLTKASTLYFQCDCDERETE